MFVTSGMILFHREWVCHMFMIGSVMTSTLIQICNMLCILSMFNREYSFLIDMYCKWMILLQKVYVVHHAVQVSVMSMRWMSGVINMVGVSHIFSHVGYKNIFSCPSQKFSGGARELSKKLLLYGLMNGYKLRYIKNYAMRLRVVCAYKEKQ